MSEAITRWTRLPLRSCFNGKSRYCSSVPSLPVNFRGRNLATLTNYSIVDEVEASRFTKEITVASITRCIKSQCAAEAEIGITSIKKQAIEQIDWSRVANGVIYIFPRANLFENSNLHGIHFERDDVAVHVLPLPLIAALARAQIVGGSYRGNDLRAFYQYGSVVHDDEVWKRAVRARGRGARKVNQMFPRRTIVVYKSQVRTHREYCMKQCPRRVEWGLGLCGFMSYNCTLAIDLEPSMLEVGPPRLEDLFDSDKEVLPCACILRNAFTPYEANNFSLHKIDFAETRGERRASAVQGGYFKRLRRLVCPSCWLYDGKGYTRHCLGCGTRPDSCSGPVFEEEIQRSFDNHPHPPEPWEIHVLSAVDGYGYGRQSVVDVDKLKPKFSWMNRLQAPWRAIRPMGAHGYYRTGFGHPMSRAAKQAERRVILMKATSKPSDEFAIVSYSEWCRMIGARQLLTWGQLYKHIPWTKYLTLHVKIALAELLRGDLMSPFCQSFTFNPDTVAFVEPGAYMQRRQQQALSSSASLHRDVLNALEPERCDENQELKEVARNRADFDFPGVEEYLERMRATGALTARESVRRKPRPPKKPGARQPLLAVCSSGPVDSPAPTC